MSGRHEKSCSDINLLLACFICLVLLSACGATANPSVGTSKPSEISAQPPASMLGNPTEANNGSSVAPKTDVPPTPVVTNPMEMNDGFSETNDGSSETNNSSSGVSNSSSETNNVSSETNNSSSETNNSSSGVNNSSSETNNSSSGAPKTDIPPTSVVTNPMENVPPPPPAPEQDAPKSNLSNVLNIEFENTKFTATLNDSPSTEALKAMLPMTVKMNDLNSNEKYYYMSNSLPTNSQSEGSIRSGDIMLYGSDCLVLFYESFSTSYSYTKLGTVNDPSGLLDALGSGAVTVTWSLSE